MAEYQVWVLGESQLTIGGGAVLDGVTQGDGSHLVGKTIRLDSHAWQGVDYSDNDSRFDDNDGDQRLSGAQIFDGITYADGTRIEAEYRLTLSDPDTGATWEVVGVNMVTPGGGPTYGTVEGLAFIGPPGGLPPTGVDLVVTSAAEGPRDTLVSEYATPLCFGAGTRISTTHGKVAVECLGPGDRVLLADGKTAPVRLCLIRRVRAAELARDPRLRPVRITAGALGGGRPSRDLVVSRQHRMLVASPIVRRMFGADEVLIAAHRLAALPGIFLDETLAEVTYVHLVLDAHRIILAEDAPTESFLVGPMALKALPPELADEMRLLFPEAFDPTGRVPAARAIPDHRRQARCVARHLRNGHPILSDAPC